jgi:hypothetical protein
MSNSAGLHPERCNLSMMVDRSRNMSGLIRPSS